MKVIDSGYKIDLHIHSVRSKGKDKGKVDFNTLENIPILAQKLNDNGVQMCAITDHDIFDYEMYCELKKYESDENSSIIKVFPGIEFSVEFLGENGGKVVHVIAIFDDEKKEKIKGIASKLTDDNEKVAYDRSQAFSEEKFLDILRSIDLDTVLIAHQKSTLSTMNLYKNDAKTVGKKRFEEFIYTDYFEAFEFKNRKNEVFNKSFLNSNNIAKNIRFITGSDCHDWRFYPRETEKDNVEFSYTYVKCIPNFRGLVMAITDHRRIKTVNSFFSTSQAYASSIAMKIDSVDYDIPLSKGINVIIGDNSIGKSLLLHKLTGYRKQKDGLIQSKVVNGYKKYLKGNKIEILTEIPETKIFAFDMQGEIRVKFEQGKLKSDDFFKSYYPSEIKSDAYMEKVQRKIKTIFSYLEEKFDLDSIENRLGTFEILAEDVIRAESLTFIDSVKKNTQPIDGYNQIISDINTIIEKIKTISSSCWFSSEDRDQLNGFTEKLDDMSVRYSKKKRVAEYENEKIALFQAAVENFKQQYQISVSDMQKKLSAYNENVDSMASNIVDLLLRRRKNKVPDFSIEEEKIEILTERVYDYGFNSRLNITEINKEYIENLFSSFMRKKIKKSILQMSQEELVDAFANYNGAPSDVLNALAEKVKGRLNDDFANKFTITQAGADRTQELSSGFNSKIYFDILSYETRHEGIYIIDQPEDNISQKSIREYLLDRFKIMGEKRQVIIVTHNPQFIVNLDVDNVIFIGKEDNKIIVQSGALEYKDEEYSILDIISNHIEGGLDTLKRRWKRYEKGASI